MKTQALRIYLLFVLTFVLCIFIGWFGVLCLGLDADNVSDTTLRILGTVMVLGGLCLFGTPKASTGFMAGCGAIAIGLYSFLRASGQIEQPWLARIIGVVCWIAVILLLYITWPPRVKQSNQ